ncbi:MAG: hypothetical protein KJ963_02550 [Bacteroidetes bacterium]|nr:hypothetical protein [Bacteroidota bacterium]MBU1423961.1 hypothetical protein [Bacteroidota bacterium]MBU2635955.1 hypothetical protein [Bacteroidota bacterium]
MNSSTNRPATAANTPNNATLSKKWEGGNRSLSLNIYRDQNLQTDDVEERIPSVSFSQG